MEGKILMGLYLYKNPETEEILEIVQTMNEPHTYEKDGVIYKRLWTVPKAAINTRVDAYNASDYDKAINKPGTTLGEAWDYSAELSEKRADKEGVDPIKKKYDDNYMSKRPALGGQKNPFRKGNRR